MRAHKLIVFLFFVTIGFHSCNNTAKQSEKLDLAKQYYAALNDSNPGEATELITSHFTTLDDGFEQNYNQVEYAKWVQWDSIFRPKYQILELEEENGIIKAKISKIDKRISFLHQDPIVTEEFIQFKRDKICSIQRNSVSFNVERFIKNRDELGNWIEAHHPELNGFLNHQTKNGGMNYIKAIELYINNN